MNQKEARKKQLEHALIAYMYSLEPSAYNNAYFECGPEYGVAECWWNGAWEVGWLTVEPCPVEIPQAKGE